MSEWRPIATAPKDGDILLFVNDRIYVGHWDDDHYSKRPKPYWRWSYLMGKTYQREVTPTHWMPLPEDPRHG